MLPILLLAEQNTVILASPTTVKVPKPKKKLPKGAKVIVGIIPDVTDRNALAEVAMLINDIGYLGIVLEEKGSDLLIELTDYCQLADIELGDTCKARPNKFRAKDTLDDADFNRFTSIPIDDTELGKAIKQKDKHKVVELQGHNLLTNYADKLAFVQARTLSEKVSIVVKKSTKREKKKTKSIIENIDTLPVPQIVKEYLLPELHKYNNLPKNSQEYISVEDYLRWASRMPWETFAKTSIPLDKIRENLTKNHYGLDEVKLTIFEHLVLEHHTNKSLGSILCFTGTPGTGKTSMAVSIANTLDRPLLRIALGGVSDESIIRGHRRTYLASRPGQIVAGLCNSKCMNPIILLDEIDKVSQVNHKGDLPSALLELLDPSQNSNFIDRYLEYPIDLSNCTFICTANYIEQIPEALLDRLEVINFPSYSEEEKKHIAQNYIIPKMKTKYHLDTMPINFEKEWYESILSMSLRDIEREISKQLRKGLVSIKIDNQENVSIYSSLNTKPKEQRKIGF